MRNRNSESNPNPIHQHWP